MSLKLTSRAFTHEGLIPGKYSKDGGNIPPPLAWTGIPYSTKSLAMIMDDPDAPSGVFVHWLIYRIPAASTELNEDVPRTSKLPGRRLQATVGNCHPIVLALPRGGVPVGFEVAQTLHTELDIFLVRKLGAPGHEELAMGAIASGGVPGVERISDPTMAETLDALAAHLERRFGRSKIVVWAHYSHLGNARATERSRYGEWNLRQLVRERYSQAVLVGFTAYTGAVTAATDWGGPHETKRVRPALPESYEHLFHGTGMPRFLAIFAGDERLSAEFRTVRLERAIGTAPRQSDSVTTSWPEWLANSMLSFILMKLALSIPCLMRRKSRQQKCLRPIRLESKYDAANDD